MSANASQNQGFLVLDEFVCQAIPGNQVQKLAGLERAASGESESMHMLACEFDGTQTHPRPNAEGQDQRS